MGHLLGSRHLPEPGNPVGAGEQGGSSRDRHPRGGAGHPEGVTSEAEHSHCTPRHPLPPPPTPSAACLPASCSGGGSHAGTHGTARLLLLHKCSPTRARACQSVPEPTEARRWLRAEAKPSLEGRPRRGHSVGWGPCHPGAGHLAAPVARSRFPFQQTPALLRMNKTYDSRTVPGRGAFLENLAAT